MKNEKDEKGLLTEEDYEFEKQRREEIERQKKEEQERLEQEAAERKEYEKRLLEEKKELLKLKNGDIDQSEIIHEEHEEKIKLTGMAWVKNFWWHNKIIIILAVFFIAVFGYITYDTVSRKKPDMQVILTCNNGILNRKDELADLFEQYCGDINGDGEVYVQIIEAPIATSADDYTTSTKYQAVIQSNLQTDDVIFFVNDAAILEDESGVADAFVDMTEYYPDTSVVDEQGLKLEGSYVQKKLKWESGFADGMYITMRAPTKTLKDSKAEMQENFDEAKEVMDKLVEEFSEHADSDTEAETEAETEATENSAE